MLQGDFIFSLEFKRAMHGRKKGKGGGGKSGRENGVMFVVFH